MKLIFKSLRPVLSLIFACSLFISMANADDAVRDMQGNITALEARLVPDKWNVVMIWASDCHVCNQEAAQYSDFHMVHEDDDAVVLGFSMDGEEGKADAEGFINRHELQFPNLIGDVRTVATWYQDNTGEAFRGTPTFVVIDGNGKVQAAQPGAVPTATIEKFIDSKS